MGVLFGIILVTGVIPLLFMLAAIWRNSSQVSSLQTDIKGLKSTLTELTEILKKHGISVPERVLPPPPEEADPAEDSAHSPEEPLETEDEEPPQEQEERHTLPPSQSHRNLEKQFGALLPVWIGGIALALAGFYLVEYSIKNNLLSPTVRVILGGFMGGALLYAAEWIRTRPRFSNDVRIAQSLSGAGISVLYTSIFAATSLYHLIAPIVGFLGMGAVTATAVTLSIRHGPPIALLGLAGGFVTPALLSSKDPSAITLFIYLYFVFMGLMFVIQRQKWWSLAFLALLGAFSWVIIWAFDVTHTPETSTLNLFILAISITFVLFSKNASPENGTPLAKKLSRLNYIGLGGAALLMGLVTARASISFFDLSLYGCLALGSMALAYFDHKKYGFFPRLSLAVNVLILGSWYYFEVNMFALTLLCFALIYTGISHFLVWRSTEPLVPWARLAGISSLVFYGLGYSQLRLKVDPSWVWTVSALGLSGLALYTLKRVQDMYQDHPLKEALLAVFAVMATSFLSIVLALEVNHTFLCVAFAAEMLAISWINTRISIKALRTLTWIIGLVIGFLLLPGIWVIYIRIMESLNPFSSPSSLIPFTNYPLIQFGIPAFMFLGASYFLRRQKDDSLVQIFEVTAVGLLVMTAYELMRYGLLLNPNGNFLKAGFFERGLITNMFGAVSLGCFFIGRLFNRSAFSWSGAGLLATALFRIIYFDLLLLNPLWYHEEITGWPLLNSLALPFGLSLIWLWFGSKELSQLKKQKSVLATHGMMLVSVFALISLNVTHFFRGPYLDKGPVSDPEIYTYSVAWLLLALGILFAGIIRRNSLLRYVSLGLMLLTVAKVFLYDASELEGLYRVFSFFGLGLSLIGISYFYTRFVFEKEEKGDSLKT